MRALLVTVSLSAAFIGSDPVDAQQSAVSAYIERAFGALPRTNCGGKLGGSVCKVPVFVAANSIHADGSSTFESPPTGSVRYCNATATYIAGPIYGFSAFGKQRRSETVPPFLDEGVTCQLDFNLNYSNMKFEGPKVGATPPTITYNLQVLNGMLVGTAPGFTSVIVFGPPSATPVRHP